MSETWVNWLGWSSVALGFLGMFVFCWIQGSELDDLRGRVDLLEEQRGNLQADLTEGFDLIHTRVDSIPIPMRVPTDTEDIVKQFHGATAYGRHAHREGESHEPDRVPAGTDH